MIFSSRHKCNESLPETGEPAASGPIDPEVPTPEIPPELAPNAGAHLQPEIEAAVDHRPSTKIQVLKGLLSYDDPTGSSSLERSSR